MKEELKKFAQAWIDGNTTAQQFPDMSSHDVAKVSGYEEGTKAWEWAVDGAAQFRSNRVKT
jgi:hypothetical protein